MRLLERYRLGPLLGEGGYGSVFRAQDTLMNREVAVKRVRHLQDRKQLAEIYKEIAILRMLNAPGVVRFLDQGEDETYVYIITALVEGRPFLAGRATWPEMVDEVSRLLSTLDQIHAVGLVHRDLKPANILVNADGQPILLDFGITQSVHPQHAFNQGGGVCGTPAYIAPEQLDEGGVITPATDLYSLGVILFEALAQAQPFEGNDPQALLWARALRPARPLGPLAPTAPPAITALVDDLLQREIDARPRSALEVLARIKRGQVEAPRLVHAGALLGREAILTRLLEDARAGRSIHLVGPPGSGRSATLAALRRRLRAEGR
ncbi:serine/threonine protein kinase, partial [Myxococcota bacterium]|nr:serine/threonine protein kinase [Myxococcota bacterium]